MNSMANNSSFFETRTIYAGKNGVLGVVCETRLSISAEI